MKKKVMMLIAVLGMAFVGQVDAQNEGRMVSPPSQETTEGWADFRDIGNGMYSCYRCNGFGSCTAPRCVG